MTHQLVVPNWWVATPMRVTTLFQQTACDQCARETCFFLCCVGRDPKWGRDPPVWEPFKKQTASDRRASEACCCLSGVATQNGVVTQRLGNPTKTDSGRSPCTGNVFFFVFCGSRPIMGRDPPVREPYENRQPAIDVHRKRDFFCVMWVVTQNGVVTPKLGNLLFQLRFRLSK